MKIRSHGLVWLAVPAVAFFAAFWLLPFAHLVALPALSDKGLATYWIVLSDARYVKVLLQTTAFSLVVTFLTIVLAAMSGYFLARYVFRGSRLVLVLLTVPLSLPGVAIGFFFIVLAGRQGLIPDAMRTLGVEPWVFAYKAAGLFAAYLYFSLPRAIASFEAAAISLDRNLEDAARALGAPYWAVARDVIVPALWPTARSVAGIVFATSMGAFGTAFTLSTNFEVLPITIYDAFTNYADFATAAVLSIVLGLVTWAAMAWAGDRTYEATK
jgi:putative spermidine/putrescine transport system permease protein